MPCSISMSKVAAAMSGMVEGEERLCPGPRRAPGPPREGWALDLAGEGWLPAARVAHAARGACAAVYARRRPAALVACGVQPPSLPRVVMMVSMPGGREAGQCAGWRGASSGPAGI